MKKIFILFLLVQTTQSLMSQTVYVKKTATGSNNGTSWANAYTNLETALQNANSGSQIWISGETYYLPGASARTASFTIENKNLALYGGFPTTGNPTLITNRNIAVHRTILSGDVNQDDVAFDANTSESSSNRSDNVYHVLKVSLNSSTYNVTIDGITIQSGNANGAGNDANGAGVLYIRTANGTGNNSHNLTFNHCEFRYHTGLESGCFYAVNQFIKNDYPNLTFTGNKFYWNNTGQYPVYSHIYGANSDIELTFTFSHNLVYRNKAFNSNSAIMLLSGMDNFKSDGRLYAKMEFNTFANNSATNGIAVAQIEGNANGGGINTMTATNNVFSLNSPSISFGKRPTKRAMSNNAYAYNVIQSNDSFNILYGNGTNLISTDVLFQNQATDNYEPAHCSRIINSGITENTFYIPAKDANQNTRIMYGTVDRGALEYQGSQYPKYQLVDAIICYGESYQLGSNQYSASGEYTVFISSASNGCDSSVILNLTVKDSLGARIGAQLNPQTQTLLIGCLDANDAQFNTYEWYYNDVLVPNETDYFISERGFGKYHAKVSRNYGNHICEGLSPDYYLTDPNSSVYNPKLQKVNIYPNPTDEIIHWDESATTTPLLFNMFGQVIAEGNFGQSFLNISNLPQGVYFLYLGTQFELIKIIKK